MGYCGIVLLIILFVPLPLWVVVLSNVNFYYDLIETKLGLDLPDEYDFIIVGSGSAGSVLTNRLSKHNKVLVIEAGGDPLWVQKVPALCGLMLHNPRVDWAYRTVPQKFAAFGYGNNASQWPRGKSMGGSSNLNAMLYVRGHPLDYDNWANMTGDPSWSYKNLLPFFKKSINYQGRYQSNEEHYGKDGEMYVSKGSFPGLDETLSKGFSELGIPVRDINGPQVSALDQLEYVQQNGRRWDSYTAFIKPILSRKNLHISRYSHATKIQLDKDNRAVGIWFIKNGVKKFVRARKEVIISAGAVESPKLLMLSGIGLRKELQEKKVKPRIDLPVGRNLMDHVWVSLSNIVINEPLTYSPPRDFGWEEVSNYLINGTGMLTVPSLFTHHAYLSSSLGDNWPDIQLYFSSLSQYWGIEDDFSAISGFKHELLRKQFQDVQGKNTFVALHGLVRPKSVGSITLQDKNPASPPIIDPRYLEHPDDVKILRESIQWTLKLIYNTTTFQKLGAYLPETPLPGCEQHVFGSAPYWDCYIRYSAATIYHPVGTCKMGRLDDPTAVVDSKLRVLGATGLRVADASIMPIIVNGNTHAPTTMVAEKAADMIREFWSNQYLICNRSENYYIYFLNRDSSVCQYSRLV